MCGRDSPTCEIKYIALFSAKNLLVLQIDSQKGERGKQCFSPEGRLSVKNKVMLLTVDRKLSDLIFFILAIISH